MNPTKPIDELEAETTAHRASLPDTYRVDRVKLFVLEDRLNAWSKRGYRLYTLFKPGSVGDVMLILEKVQS